jgi:hypothetical protein
MTKNNFKKWDTYTFTVRNQKIKELTEINFTFIKTPICKPPFETVRNAGKALGIGKRSNPEIVIEKDSDEPANCKDICIPFLKIIFLHFIKNFNNFIGQRIFI